MQLKGPVQAKVTVGDVDETLPVYVADLEENLLGLDYLKESKAVLDFGDMTMGIGNRKVPLLEGGSDVRVLTACATRIPPMSCRLSRMMEGEGLVSPSSQQSLPEGVIVGRTLVPPEQEEVRVVVANLSSEPRDVREGALMGTCEVVQREKSTEVMPSGPRVCDTESSWEGPYTVEDRITDVAFRIRRGPRTRPMVVHADRLWRYYGPGTFTWGGLEDAEASNSDEELGCSSPMAMTDDDVEYATEEPPGEVPAPLESPLAGREDDTINQRTGVVDGTNQEQETVEEGRPRRTHLRLDGPQIM
ncbi:hypothetical protein O3P69_020407 [Scylla paramamosain]|uniref:Integrase p58-like C-terminal domain-containing protein n=1 Tax=Scylla paramamosain TaxID=85552 RepID=A0AAW0TME0_SCYPA